MRFRLSRSLCLFQHTAARRRLVADLQNTSSLYFSFNTQPPEGGWDGQMGAGFGRYSFNTQPPEGGWAILKMFCSARRAGFNTQPPEGGWDGNGTKEISWACFNTQPPEGGWLMTMLIRQGMSAFQHTAARRRLGDDRFRKRRRHRFNTQPPEGGWRGAPPPRSHPASFNTQPPEGGWRRPPRHQRQLRGFNTQPPEGGWVYFLGYLKYTLCFNTQPPEGGWRRKSTAKRSRQWFQHTAARRRLGGVRGWAA